MAHKFFLSDSILRKGDNIIFLFNCGGKTQYDRIKIFLSSYIPLFNNANIFPQGSNEIIRSSKYLFLYDADAEGIGIITTNLKKELDKIEETNFIDGHWNNSSSVFGKIAGNKAVYVWGNKPEKGTLEDILIPMFESNPNIGSIMDRAKTAMTDMFEWKTGSQNDVEAVAELERYKKAVMTTAGQRKKSGYSLNVILEQSGLITQEALASSHLAKEFVKFLNEFLSSVS
jgi:hypothetical protein